MQVEQYDSLVSSIYAASYQPGGWTDALEGIRSALDFDAFALMRFPSRFAGNASPELVSVGGTHVTTGAAQKYDSYYGAIDPRTEFVRQHSVGEVFLCERHFDLGFVSRSEFYQDFLLPEGLRFCMGTCIRLPDQTDFALGQLRSADRGSFSPESQQIFKRLIGHLSQSLLAYERLTYVPATSDGIADAISWGTLHLDRLGRFMGCNRLADALLVAADLIKIKSGALAFYHSETQLHYSRAFARCVSAKRAETFVAESSCPGTRRFTMTLLPAPNHAEKSSRLADASQIDEGHYIGILAPLDKRRIPSVDQLMDIFDFAPAEARLARSLASGDSVSEYAAAHSVAMSTVRTQLRAILRKTGTERQAQVVRLLNNIPAIRGL